MASIDLSVELRQALLDVMPELKALVAGAVSEALAKIPSADLDREVGTEEGARLVGLSIGAFRKAEARGRWHRLPDRGRSVRFKVRDLVT